MDNFSGDVTLYLSQIRAGDAEAKVRLLELVLSELRPIAARILQSERPDHTLQPTALINELYLQLMNRDRMDVRDRSHFLSLAVQAMRRILVDHARSKRSKKRGGQFKRIEIEGLPVADRDNLQLMIEVDEALTRLEKLDPRQCHIVELRFFAGLEEAEIARLLGVSDRTVKRDWAMAKAWLYGELQPGKQNIKSF